MRVVNLVFNRIGNSFSAMIEYDKFNIQITDSVMFSVYDTSVEVMGISVDVDCPLKIYLNIGGSRTDITFDNDRVYIENLWNFIPSEEGFLSDNSELLFLSGTDKNLSAYLKEGKLFIPQEEFLKSVAKFVIKKM